MTIKIKNTALFLMSLTVVSATLQSCKKLIAVPPPQNQLVTSSVFDDSAGATAAIIGIYSNLNPYTSFVFGNGAITAYTGLASDELVLNNASSEESQFYTNSIAPGNSINNGSLWSLAYSSVYQANACMEGLSASGKLSASLKNQLLGEAKFLRAFIYFNLVNLYGDIPLVTSTNYKANAVTPRIAKDSVYLQIIADLNDAAALLNTSYASGTKVRANKYAALSLLARVYLFTGDWQAAEAFSAETINSGQYSLEPDLKNVFLTNSSESIWQMPPYGQGMETTEGYFFVPYDVASVPKYTISASLLNAFESGDERKSKWLNKNTVSINGTPTDFYYPFKYKLGYDGNTEPVENYIVLRLAEQYLIRAEARANLDDLKGALSDLNSIRTRAGLSPLNITTRANLLDAILHERQVEFFCEWGQRWFDLKRTGTINATLSSEKPSWQQTAALFPIPAQQIHTNPFLIQNPGY